MSVKKYLTKFFMKYSSTPFSTPADTECCRAQVEPKPKKVLQKFPVQCRIPVDPDEEWCAYHSPDNIMDLWKKQFLATTHPPKLSPEESSTLGDALQVLGQLALTQPKTPLGHIAISIYVENKKLQWRVGDFVADSPGELFQDILKFFTDTKDVENCQ